MENLIDENLIAKIKGIQIRAKSLVNDVFAGDYVSAFKGRGLEFEEVREYQPGDDVRTIDWNVTARTDRPFVKTFRDERELTVMFLVDVSASNRFGSHLKFKNEIAAEITALLAYTAMRSSDKVGLIVFSDHVEHYIPAKKGSAHIWRIIKDILSYESKSKSTDLVAAVSFLNKVVKKKSITFLLSDFQDDHYESDMKILGRKHDLIAMGLEDRREVEIPKIGYVELEDSETGEYVLVNTSDPRFSASFSSKTKEFSKAKENFFRSSGIDFIKVATDKDYLDPIVRFFRSRDKRNKR